MVSLGIYCVVVSLVLAGAAWTAEHACLLRRTPIRGVWIAALLASLLVPALIRLTPVGAPRPGEPAQHTIPLPDLTSLPALSRHWLAQDPPVAPANRSRHYLPQLWAATSLVMLAMLLANGLQLRLRSRAWRRTILAGGAVCVTADLGPAVVGFLRPQVVVPAWLLDAPAATQAEVIAHERAHIDAHDPGLLLCGIAVVVLMPWNLPLWWQLRRLRQALEVDCDARVLSGGCDARHYGETLIAVGERRSRWAGPAAAMSEDSSFLERRIRIMIGRKPRNARPLAAALGMLSIALVAVAAQVAPPAADSPARTAPTPAELTAAALERLSGFYQYADNTIVTVRRAGQHLTIQFPGEPAPVPIDPRGEDDFAYREVDARIHFTRDAGGTPVAAQLLQNGAVTNMPRVAASVAARSEEATARKLYSKSATPGTAAALAALIDGLAAGHPDLSRLNPQLAGALAKDAPRFQSDLSALGARGAISFVGVDTGGLDLYRVEHARGSSLWSIKLDSAGKIISLFWKPDARAS